MTKKPDRTSQHVTPQDAQEGGQSALGEEHPEIGLRQDARPAAGRPPEVNNAPAELTASQIALLCDIGQRPTADLPADRKGDLDRLVADGYATPAEGGASLALTRKGIDFLGKRGAGLNEA